MVKILTADDPVEVQNLAVSIFKSSQRSAISKIDNQVYSTFCVSNRVFDEYDNTMFAGTGDYRLFTHKQGAVDPYSDFIAVIAKRVGSTFSFYFRDDLTTAKIVQTITLSPSYAIYDWVIGYHQDGANHYALLIVESKYLTNHKYDIYQLTAGATNLLHTTTTFVNEPNIPAPRFYYSGSGWYFNIFLQVGSNINSYSCSLSASPFFSWIRQFQITVPGTWITCEYSVLYKFLHQYHILLKNSADNSYAYFSINDNLYEYKIARTGLVIYPQFELLAAAGAVPTYDIEKSTISVQTKNYPGLHPIRHVPGLTDNIFGFGANIFTKIGNSIMKILVTRKNLLITNGTLDKNNCNLTVAVPIPVFDNMHLILYSDKDELITRAVLRDVAYSNGQQQLQCEPLTTEINTIYNPDWTNAGHPLSFISEQLNNLAQFSYVGVVEGSEQVNLSEGYPLDQMLYELGLIFNGIGYIDPSGAVHFRLNNFDEGPTLKISNANYLPATYQTSKGNYGKTIANGAFYAGDQQFGIAVDLDGDQSLVYEIDCPSMKFDIVLNRIAQNVLNWQKAGVTRVQLRYLFGPLHRGQRLKTNLTGWGIKFGQSDPLADVDMFVLSARYNLRTNQSEIELCNTPQYTSKTRISADINQQQTNLQKQIGFSAFGAYKNTETLIPHSTAFKLIYDKKSYDLNGDYNVITGRFTAPYRGIYHFNASYLTTWDNWQAGDTYRLVFHKNGTPYYRANWNTIQANIAQNMASFGAMDVFLNQNDYIEVIVIFSRVNRAIFAGAGDNLFEGHLVRRID